MASYKPVVVQSFPKLGEKITQDTLYWKNYKTPVQIKEFGAVNKIDFSPVPPYNYAVTASSRIHIYGRYSQEPIKTFSRFKDAAYCATYRDDGKLLVAGSEEGVVRLFDITGRAALRQFDGHTKAVHVVDFLSDKYRVVSGADDYTSKVWDIPSATAVVSYSEHTDYVRCGCISKLNADLFVTGSYDHTVKVFDARREKSVMTVEHGQPVESVLLFPSGGLLVSAGGRYVKVWDILRGGQLLVSLKNHHKTVTCLCLSSSGQRLLSGSLDRHVKIYSTTSYKVVHSFNYAASILSLALAPEDETIVVGMTNGVLNVRHRKHEESKERLPKKKRPAYRTFVKGRNYMPKQEDFFVSKPVRSHLKKYDKLLKSFQVSKALDTVLQARNKTPEITVAVMQELNRRGTLKNALAGRDETQLSILMSFLIRYVVEPRFAPMLIKVAEMIIDIYLPVVGQSAVIDKQFLKLQEIIEKEIDYQTELLEVLGMMDALFATMTMKKATSLEKNKTNDAVTMELSCTQVPLYGQMTIQAKFDKDIYLPEDAEFYFVYDGSTQRHITFAERINNNALQSIIPGHGCQETVSVSVFMYMKGCSPVTLGCSSVTYRQNLACKLSHFLISHFDCVTSTSHQTLLSKFGLTVEDLQSLDHDVMLAIAHEELPPTWNILGSCSEDESNCRETLLHLTVRFGLVKLSQFLLSQPGGLLALALPNEAGATPLDLASQNGHSRLVEIFMNFQGSHSFDISRVVISEYTFLQFAHSSRTLTLTFNRTTEHLLESDIKLFRKYFLDRTSLYKSLNSKQAGTVEGSQMPCNSTDSTEDPVNLESDSPAPGSEDVKPFKDTVVPSNENEDQVLSDIELRHSALDVLKKSPNPPAFFAAATHTAMLNGSDEVYANCMVVDQGRDLDVNYINVDSITTEISTDHTCSTLTPNSSSSVSLKKSSQYVYAENEDNQMAMNNIDNIGSQLFTSPSNVYAAGSYLPLKSRGFNTERSQLYADLKKRSSSLDDLEVDSGSEGISDRSHIRYPSLNSSVTLASSRDELDSSETSTDLDYSIHRMDSNNLLSKESLLSGIRSRSYSCSSPKVLLGKSRFSRDFTVCDSNEEQRAYSLPEQSREKRIKEEEWDKYIIPTKSESEKYKVSRTFSFLMNRMTSTRNKCKTKNKEAKDKLNRHQFITGNFSGNILCMACDKALLGKESLQCSYCNVIVHKNCKDCAPACTKKFQERYHVKTGSQAVLTNSSFRDLPQPIFSSIHPSSSMPTGLSAVKKEVSQQPHALSRSVPCASFERRSMPSADQDTDSSSWRANSQPEMLLQSIGTLPSMDSFVMEDDVDSSLWTDLSTEAQEFEAESWSLVVDPAFCSKQEKDVIKRQDVIFELMQTEVHHIHTLFIMSEIFRKGMKEELQLDHSTVDRIFPCLDELLEIHRQFFCTLKERRQESCEGGNERNFLINRIGDILVQQFSEESANKMKKIYGEFCSHQKEAVNIFKELQQNKKFQNFIKLRNSNLLARRRGIPECILLVTQRITKYPVLVERILQYSKEGTEEHKDLCSALCLIKDMIAAVDLKVNDYEKSQKLLEILNKIENKTFTKLKNGHVFRKQDLKKKERTLLHEGLVYWKTATGRFKDSLALLLTDVLLFLQEKDQKYIFATVDQKPSVISLQKLIVREVANEERGMFLISASSAGPEMYEIHTNSKEERNTWMRQIQDAVESCPEEEGKISESDEDRQIAEAKAAKIQKYQESLSNQDQQICSYLEDKLHIYAELGDMSGFEDVHVEPHLLIKPDSGEMPQASSLLAAALKEAESLHVAVTSSQANDTNRSSEESPGEPSLRLSPSTNEIVDSSTDSTEIKGDEESFDFNPRICHAVNEVADSVLEEKVEHINFSGSTSTEVVQAIQNLTRLLYSIQAAVTIQDSHVEIHKTLLQEHERTSCGHSSRGNLLLDQEKYRNLEKQREELANIQKLQQQFHQEQQRWARECDQQQREQEIRESQLQERERDCMCQEENLHRNQGELEHQLQEFQQDLERLKEGQRMVEIERDKVKMQQKILWHWQHSRQSSLPATLPSSVSNEIMGRNQMESFCGENSFFINEALVQMSLNSLNRSNPTLVYQDGVYGINTASSEISRTSENPPAVTHELWKSTAPCHQVSSCKSNKDSCNNDLTLSQIQCPRTHSLNPGCIQVQPLVEVELLNPPSYSSQDAENGARVEENIVYL